MTNTQTEGTTLTLRRTFDVPRDRVFAAFTEPEQLKRWYAPVKGWVVTTARVDLRVGGGFHLEFGPPGGTPLVEDATYVEITPPERLVYTLKLQGQRVAEETRVTVEFSEAAGGTEVVITESGYSSAEVRDMHLAGFTRMVEQLAEIL